MTDWKLDDLQGESLTSLTDIITPTTAGYGHKLGTGPGDAAYPWVDLLGDVSPRGIAESGASVGEFQTNQPAWFFGAGEYAMLHYHIPHVYAKGTDTHIHVHWGHNGTAISGSLVLDLYLAYAKGHNQAIFSAVKQITVTVATPDIATIPQYRHRTDEVPLSVSGGDTNLLDTDDFEPDGIIQGKIVVTTIPTITGGSPNEPAIFTVDLHHQSATVGTVSRLPDFYVAA